MNILAIETSTKNFSLAVGVDDRVLAHQNARVERILDESIIPSIDALLRKTRLKISDVDVIAVGLGPGSFTSLRVGLATVKGLCMATESHVVGISSLDVIAANVTNSACDEICVLMDARRDSVYACLYQVKKGELVRKSDYQLTSLDEILDKVQADTLFVGDGLVLYRERIIQAYKQAQRNKKNSCTPIFAEQSAWFPDARKLFELARRRVSKKKYDDVRKLNPIYLYRQDCQVQK